MRVTHFLTALLGLVALSGASLAETGSEASKWTGEGNLTAGFTSGNTETTDFGAGLRLAREMGGWKNSLEFNADYGDIDGVESKNRVAAAYQLDRNLSDRTFTFVRGSYEVDEFSGFDSRAFVGGGIGHKAIVSEKTNWTLEAAPGLRRDELSSGATEDSFAVRAASRFSHAFNDNVSFSNDTTLNYADVSTQIVNTAALTAKLSEKLAARASFEVRNESDPLPFREATDTATRLSLVYGF